MLQDDLRDEVGSTTGKVPDGPFAAPSLDNAGVERFFAFEKRIEALDKQLRSFTNAARQVGSSVGIISSASKLRERLAKILFLFRENAANLYPRKIARQAPKVFPNPDSKHRQRRAGIVKHVLNDSLKPDTLTAQFESFAEDIATFINCLNELPEFMDEPINQSMRSFQDDLKYWASCLAEYETQFPSPAVRHYIHDLTTGIDDHLDTITETLSMFIETGVPTIRFQQQHSLSNLLNLSTVATIFSAVTATMLQLSCKSTGHTLADLVNTFWFSSLVFSMAAAVNSFLGLTWKQAIYRSSEPRIPWWALIWIKQTPLVFLVLSIACFSAGLVLFTYSSGQGTVTRTMITVLTAVTSFGLAAVATRFASERWMLIQYKGQKWVEEAILEMTNRLANTGIARTGRISWRWCSMRIAIARGYLRRLASWIIRREQSKELLPFVEPQVALPVCSISVEAQVSSADGRTDQIAETHCSDPRLRFAHATRSVVKLQATARPMSPRRNSWWSDTPMVPAVPMSPDRFPDPRMSSRGVPMSSAIDKLKTLGISREAATHQAPVRCLQFSPNGEYLATSSWGRTSVILRVGESFTAHRTLVHVRGIIGQVAWSPDGRLLLTKVTRAVKVWSVDGVCKKTIDRQNTVQSVVWLPTGDAFLSVEGNEVVKLDLHGKVLDIYHLGQIQLINVAVTPDCCRLVGVGPSITSPSGPQPSRRSIVEKRIVVYNMQTRLNESHVPLANDIRDIAMARKRPIVLISPEKGTPQLWRLDLVRDRNRAGYALSARPSLRHTFALEAPVDQIAGPSHFGGRDDQFVLCPGKTGDIHIWDRETAAHLHCIRPRNTPGDGKLTCIGWNCATDDPMMLATGNQDGTIHIYSTAALDGGSGDSSSSGERMEDDRARNDSVHSGG